MELQTEVAPLEAAANQRNLIERSAGHNSFEATKSNGCAPVTAEQPQQLARAEDAEGNP